MQAGNRVMATRQRGFGWLLVLMMLAIASAAGAAVAQRWSDQMAREKERQLLRVGDAFARALADYHASSPGSDKRFPPTLEQLVLDTRFVGTRRHLRTIYPDPLTGQPDWVACWRSVSSGSTATGCCTRDNKGRSLCESL